MGATLICRWLALERKALVLERRSPALDAKSLLHVKVYQGLAFLVHPSRIHHFVMNL